ncbi:hypothetical protein ACFQ0T_17100 [Kitasatospora gansuensis]
MHRDGAHAPELARSQGIGAADLRTAGLVDRIVPERPDAAEEPLAFAGRVAEAIGAALGELTDRPAERRHADRQRRNRRLGGA